MRTCCDDVSYERVHTLLRESTHYLQLLLVWTPQEEESPSRGLRFLLQRFPRNKQSFSSFLCFNFLVLAKKQFFYLPESNWGSSLALITDKQFRKILQHEDETRKLPPKLWFVNFTLKMQIFRLPIKFSISPFYIHTQSTHLFSFPGHKSITVTV